MTTKTKPGPGGAREGAGRKVGKLGRTTSSSVSLAPPLWKKADRLVIERGFTSRSALFAAMIRQAKGGRG